MTAQARIPTSAAPARITMNIQAPPSKPVFPETIPVSSSIPNQLFGRIPSPAFILDKRPMKIEAVKDITTNRVLIEGPAVSLKGSPTVSPVIAALLISVPFPPR